jgi:hypothetical protein
MTVPFHETVQDVLRILSDERSAHAERSARATVLLRSLPFPLPTPVEQEKTAQAIRTFERELREHGQAVTFRLGNDGQFRETIYRAQEDEQLLNDHEGASG